jgi:omega-amidase
MANAPLDDSITREYPAESLVIEWRQGLCAHSGNCVRALPRVFNPRRQPWVQTDGADVDDLREAVARCPSGALRVREGAG